VAGCPQVSTGFSTESYRAVGAIGRAIDYLVTHPDMQMVYGQGQHVDADGAFLEGYPSLPPDTPYGVFSDGCFICQPTAFFRRSAFDAAGGFRLPIGTIAGGVPMTVRGDVSQAEVTLWYQALELKPSAELTAYMGPPGTVVSFTGRSFAGGERVTVHLQDRGGTSLASAVASDDGTVEGISSYPIEGNWGDDVHFVLIGDESHAEGSTDFKIANPVGIDSPTTLRQIDSPTPPDPFAPSISEGARGSCLSG